MNRMGIQAIFPKKKKLTSIKNQEHKIYPYLLRNLDITKPNQVWSGDITYIPTKNGFMYLAAIIDWNSRSILTHKLSNCMDTSLVTSVLKEAIEDYGTPEIMNTDQGSQYTSKEHVQVLKDNNIKVSMNGKRRSIDNIAIERFFRTLKYDEIYLQEYKNVSDLKKGINRYIDFYNHKRFHSALNHQKPMTVYRQRLNQAS